MAERDARAIVVGGDGLALLVCEKLREGGQAVTLLWPNPSFAERATAAGATFMAGEPTAPEALVRAGVGAAACILVLTDDDRLNVEASLRARDLNEGIRIVMRQFNRELGRKIEANLDNSAVVSLASQSAATFAGAALDEACFCGVQFPDIDGALLGFSRRTAAEARVTGRAVADAERELESRIIAVDEQTSADERDVLGADAVLLLAGVPGGRAVESRVRGRRELALRPWERLTSALHAAQRTGPVAIRLVLVAALTFASASVFFANVMHLDPLRAVYFVTTTMTTTGYGDVTPQPVALQEIAAMLTMLAGVIFSGVFVALVASYLTQSEYRLLLGLRPIHRRGHIVVCGSGRVGSRVVQFLRALGRDVVVIERNPHSDVVELARERKIDLLTGDATSDATLDLCNIGHAAAVIALTDSDAGNLEVALGARRYRDAIPVVLRVGEGAFATSIARHFGLRNTFGTAQLAGPAFAALSRAPGVRGFLTIGSREYTISEFNGVEGEPDPRSVAGAIPIARRSREGRTHLLSSFGSGLTDRPLLYIHPVS